jgi:hypothetical protein
MEIWGEFGKVEKTDKSSSKKTVGKVGKFHQ